MASVSEIVAYIRQAAIQRGIDPNVAVAVANSEGLKANPADGRQSNVYRNGVREPSFGVYQLYMGGGLGNVFQKLTGHHPRDNSTTFQQIDFALDHAAKYGWGAWHGAKAIGLSNNAGLNGSHAVGISENVAASQYSGGDPRAAIARMPVQQSSPSRPTRLPTISLNEMPSMALTAPKLGQGSRAKTVDEPAARAPVGSTLNRSTPPPNSARNYVDDEKREQRLGKAFKRIPRQGLMFG